MQDTAKIPTRIVQGIANLVVMNEDIDPTICDMDILIDGEPVCDGVAVVELMDWDSMDTYMVCDSCCAQLLKYGHIDAAEMMVH